MSANIEVVAFGVDTFRRLMEETSMASRHAIEIKSQAEYFQSYFNEIKPVTMVVERDYVDRDYLEDFSAYYVRCFQPFPRFCTRVHFFQEAFGEADFKALLRAEASIISEPFLQQSYQGFIVLKPLPVAFVGKTCLRTYDENGVRSYPIKRTYTAHLCGIRLEVESLAFQEQDSVAAACATSALWSAFHGTGIRFQHSIPSPVEITKSATSGSSVEGRFLPNKGLTIEQMAQGVRSVGLEPHTLAAHDEITFRSTIFSYLSAKIPVSVQAPLRGV